jgi:hypothetical protein
MDVNPKIGGTFLESHQSHRAVAGLNVPTDTPAAESIPGQPAQIPGLMVVLNAEAPVITIKEKVPLFGQGFFFR